MKKQTPWFTILCWVAAFIVAWFYNFQPDYEYSWYWMFFHGWLIIPNWIYSWFIDAKLCRPEMYTTAYNIFWWLSVICSSLSIIFTIFNFIIVFTLGNKKE